MTTPLGDLLRPPSPLMRNVRSCEKSVHVQVLEAIPGIAGRHSPTSRANPILPASKRLFFRRSSLGPRALETGFAGMCAADDVTIGAGNASGGEVQQS